MKKYDPDLPLYLNRLFALERRLTPNHPRLSEIKREAAIRHAGFNGEKSMTYHLRHLDKQEYNVMGSIRLKGRHGYYFQMDNLIITPNFLVILEVKSMAGELLFDRIHHQLLRTINGITESFQDPILQVQEQEFELHQWLTEHKFPQIPIAIAAVIPHPSTIIKMIPENSKDMKYIIRGKMLHKFLMKQKNTHSKTILSKNEMKKLISTLKRKHSPYDADVLSKYDISPDHLKRGVFCPDCEDEVLLRRVFSKWECPICKHTSKDAYKFAIMDYFLLIDETITNKQLRSFLTIDSRSISQKILKSLQCPRAGKLKHTTYHLTLPILDQSLRHQPK
ncbi:nuclease-related domain-containing protein [Falsibacillus pallidus]|uniref:Nuclease-like protein n=1 Tax=Falsibacillus pallidus TaxID=493781 RepID=A0A370GGV3_9BACI|nr:nuclease-related domain-containing protein [Falsibacillus pallidus]RDI41614.1 nuclease-like protein [Falsibacillus pallidus]